MPSLFSELPVLLQLLPGLDRGVIVGVNRVGQMLVVAAGVMAIYQEQFLKVFLQWLRATATVLRLLAAGVGWSWSKGGVGIEFPRLLSDKIFQEDVEVGKQVLISTLALAILLWFTGRGPLGWLSFPFEVAWSGITVWAHAQWNFWSFTSTIGESVMRLFGFVPLFYLAILACVIVTRPYAFFLSRAAERISSGHYRLVMLVVFLIGSFLVAVAT